MSNRKLSGKALVMQITREEIRVARMSLGAASPQILEKVVLPTPEGAVEDGDLRNLDALRATIEPVLREKEFRRCRRVVFAMCSTQVIAESVTTPAVNRRQRLGQMLEANMDMYFPVNPQEYRLTWQVVGKEQESDQLRVQLWAAPRLLLGRYYALANSMGLTVAAVDFCGHSLAAAMGVSFAASGGKGEKDADAGMGQGSGASLYINAESELLLLTFVQNGQVKLQRLLQRGFSQQEDLDEVGMALDYFTSVPGHSDLAEARLSGGHATELGLSGGLSSLLGVSVRPVPNDYGPEWLLCQGASKTDLDFGDPEMNHLTGTARPINRAWQYGLIFLGGAALTASVMLLLTSSLTWSTQLNSMQSTQNQLMVMAQKNAGSADRYHTYEDLYNNYSADWDRVFGSIRTYNDNVEWILGGLETQLPKDATVTALSMADQGLAVQVAFQDKEDAAYFLLSLRDEPYMEIKGISGLTIGPGTSPDSMISQLYTESGLESPVPEAVESGEEESGTEAPPTEGGYLDGLSVSGLADAGVSSADLAALMNGSADAATLQQLLPVLLAANGGQSADLNQLSQYAGLAQGLEGSGSSMDAQTLLALLALAGNSGSGSSGSANSALTAAALAGLLNDGTTGAAAGSVGTAVKNLNLTENQLKLNMQYLTGSQIDALHTVYGKPLTRTYALTDLLKTAKEKQRKTAVRTLLKDDPAAMYKFFLLMQEDIERSAEQRILYELIFDDVWENANMNRMFYESDQKMLDNCLPKLLDILTKNKENLEATEQLIRSDAALTEKLATHLAKAMGKTRKGELTETGVDLAALLKDINSGEVWKKDAKTVDAVMALMPADIQRLYRNGTDGTGSGGISLADILGLMSGQGGGMPNIFNPGGSQTQQPADTRYYLTILLGYDDSLLDAELSRKGLETAAKVEKVEVDR